MDERVSLTSPRNFAVVKGTKGECKVQVLMTSGYSGL